MNTATIGVCRLCRHQRELRRSHFMPAALYPRNKKQMLATPKGTFVDFEQVCDRLLCKECEARFNRNGEDEVLRWMAPKAKNGMSPLLSALRERTPAYTASDLTCHWGSSLGIVPD